MSNKSKANEDVKVAPSRLPADQEVRVAKEVEVERRTVMVRAKEPGFHVGRRRVGEIFSFDARVNENGEVVLGSWMEIVQPAELKEIQEREQAELGGRHPPGYRLSLAESSSPPPPPEVKPTAVTNPADGQKAVPLAEGAKAVGQDGKHGKPGADLV